MRKGQVGEINGIRLNREELTAASNRNNVAVVGLNDTFGSARSARGKNERDHVIVLRHMTRTLTRTLAQQLIPCQRCLRYIDTWQTDNSDIIGKHLFDAIPVFRLANKDGFGLGKFSDVLSNICIQGSKKAHADIAGGHDGQIREEPMRSVSRQEQNFGVFVEPLL